MITDNATAVQSNEELAKLADGNVLVQAKYSFQNPFSINGPFGTLDVTISEDSTGQTAVGKVAIQTLFGMGTETNMQYDGSAVVNSATGSTSVKTLGKGTITAWPDAPKPIAAEISFTLASGYESGTISVSGFFDGFALMPISVHVG
ncbi:hypothetical protein D3C71_732590 [compost metagenome]